MKALLFAGLFAFTSAVSAPAQPQNPMRPGRWEITMQMEMPGMPVKMPPQKNVQCVTKEEVEKLSGGLPGGADPDQKNDCKITDHKITGNKITWTMTCTEPQPMTGNAEIVVEGDTYTGTMTMTTPNGQMTFNYNAKRLGECEP